MHTSESIRQKPLPGIGYSLQPILSGLSFISYYIMGMIPGVVLKMKLCAHFGIFENIDIYLLL